MKLPETCSAQDLASALNRPYPWILEAAREGRIPSLKVGGRVRFTQEQVDAIITSFTRGASGSVEVAGDEWGRPARAVARERSRRRTA